MQNTMSVGQLAKEAGVNLETVRFYERERIMPEPERTMGGHRVYTANDLGRLRFIQRAKSVGFTLKEVRTLVRLRDANPDESCDDVMSMAHRKLAEVEIKLQELTEMRDALAGFIRACPNKDLAHCQVMNGLSASGAKAAI
jgi:MerR family transcriptional regulator, copper efflux regulator